MIALIESMSAQRSKEMREHAASRRLAARFHRERPRHERAAGRHGGAAIRRIDAVGADRAELERLAGRDSATPPSGDVIAAELGGNLIAALSLTTGELVSDPFTPTADARAALMARARLLRGGGRRVVLRIPLAGLSRRGGGRGASSVTRRP